MSKVRREPSCFRGVFTPASSFFVWRVFLCELVAESAWYLGSTSVQLALNIGLLFTLRYVEPLDAATGFPDLPLDRPSDWTSRWVELYLILLRRQLHSRRWLIILSAAFAGEPNCKSPFPSADTSTAVTTVKGPVGFWGFY